MTSRERGTTLANGITTQFLTERLTSTLIERSIHWRDPQAAIVPHNMSCEFLCGAVTSVLATWECYVNDLFTECFRIVKQYDPGLRDSSSSEWNVSSAQECSSNSFELRRLRKRWPDCVESNHQQIKSKFTLWKSTYMCTILLLCKHERKKYYTERRLGLSQRSSWQSTSMA